MAESGSTRSLVGTVGWLALTFALLAAIPLGANRPVSWIGLFLVSSTLFAAGLVLEMRDPSVRAARLWPSAMLASVALVWGLVQVTPGLLPLAEAVARPFAAVLGLSPPDLAHPVWASVDAAPAISADPIDGRHALLRLTCYLGLFWLALQGGRDEARARMMLTAAAVGVTLVSAFGIFAVATGTNPVVGPDADTLSATFVNRNSFATYAAFGVCINLAFLLTRMGGGHRASTSRPLRDFLERFVSGGWIHLVGFAICTTALLGSQSRGGTLAGLFGALFIMSLSMKGDRRRSAPVAILVLVAAFVVFGSTAAGVFGRLMATSSVEEMRVPVYHAVIQGIMDRPLIGHGLGSFWDVFRAYVPPAAGLGEWDKAHNTYLELAFELGIPAACAFLLAILIVVVRVIRGAARRDGDPVVPFAAAGCALTASVHSLFDFSLQIPAVAALFAIVLGLGYARSFGRRA